MTLFDKITALYSQLTYADFMPESGTILLQNDGKGDYIAKWEHPTLARPINEQLANI
jgi:hypothetical protein